MSIGSFFSSTASPPGRLTAPNPAAGAPRSGPVFAELGLLGLPFTEDEGGFGGTPIETSLVMEAFGPRPRGRTLFPQRHPLRRPAPPRRKRRNPRPAHSRRARWQARCFAYAQAERQSRYALHDIATTARPAGAQWRIDGSKSLVLAGDTANSLLVTARTSGGQGDQAGIGLFLVDADQPGVARRFYPTQDGMRAAEITFTAATASPLGDPGNALPLWNARRTKPSPPFAPKPSGS